ncbi:hypothetical protein ACFSQU_18055 [Massilia sp. GCM10020059]|uniref:Terminase small subunit n=1 Tax=Massilia agrisoli TaxID=2892444 RepID=A0ABS8IU20_9BURK|nr:hypothetical protein [Massilia agrisoli]MCC6071446.1 hypothetical protein [Massilia agrisoli]
MPNLTTIADWAKTLGISRQSGYDAITRCGIPVDDGKVDPEYATHLYQKHTRPRANGQRKDGIAHGAPSASPAGAGGAEPLTKVPSYDASRARREAAEAQLAEMKQAEMAGKFLLKDDVESQLFEIARALRDGLTNCARRIAADVAALSTAEECEVAIDREHRALLDSMSHSLGAKLGLAVDEVSA